MMDMVRWRDILLGAAAGFVASMLLKKALPPPPPPPPPPPKESTISLPKPVPEEPEESVTGPSEEPRYTEEPEESVISEQPVSEEPIEESAPPSPPPPGPEPEVIPPSPGQMETLMHMRPLPSGPPYKTLTIPSRLYTLGPGESVTIFEEGGLTYANVCIVGMDYHPGVNVYVEFSTVPAAEPLHYTWCSSGATSYVAVRIVNYGSTTVSVTGPEVRLELWK